MTTIRTIETTDGLYVKLNDILALVLKVHKTYPSRVTQFILSILYDGEVIE